jgi:branched-chain amino acid transport system ATP-binding protein
VRFGGLTALNRVDFEVKRGEIRAVIGPNGAGKSTFFNCLTGVIRPTSGKILFNGENIAGLPPNRISQKGIARSYQITNILPNATTLENVRIAAQSRRHAWSMLTHHADFHDIIDKAQGRARVGRPGRQGRRARRQPLARRAAQPRDRHRACHRAAALCLDEPTGGHELGGDA